MDAKFWLSVLFYVLNSIALFYVWMGNRRAATAKSISDLETKVAADKKEIETKVFEMATKMATFDERLKVAIDQTALKPVYDRINSMDKQLGEINGKMHTLDLIHEFLMKGGK